MSQKHGQHCSVFWCLYNKGKKPQDVFYTVNMSLESLMLTNILVYLTGK